MKVIMFGAPICGDCVIAKEELLKNNRIELDYRNITENVLNMREFLQYRDKEEMFQKIKEAGRIGIPLFILEDGTMTFEMDDFAQVKEEVSILGSTCSIDGKGHC